MSSGRRSSPVSTAVAGSLVSSRYRLLPSVHTSLKVRLVADESSEMASRSDDVYSRSAVFLPVGVK